MAGHTFSRIQGELHPENRHVKDNIRKQFQVLPNLGFPARNTRNENPRPFSNGSTVAVTSSTGYRTVASP